MPRFGNARRILLIVSTALVQLLPAQTESAERKIARIGMLSDAESFGNPISPQDWLAAFHAGLGDAGYSDSQNIHFE